VTPISQFLDAKIISTMVIVSTIASAWGSLRASQHESTKKIANIEKKLGISNGAPPQFVTTDRCDEHHDALSDRLRRIEGVEPIHGDILQRVASIEAIVEGMREHFRRPRHTDENGPAAR